MSLTDEYRGNAYLCIKCTDVHRDISVSKCAPTDTIWVDSAIGFELSMHLKTQVSMALLLSQFWD